MFLPAIVFADGTYTLSGGTALPEAGRGLGVAAAAAAIALGARCRTR